MLNAASLRLVNSAVGVMPGGGSSQTFVKPLYASYCFANIPQTIAFLLTGEGDSALPQDIFGGLPTRYNKVVLFFVDAFGWKCFEQYADKYEFLKIILNHGVVSKLTSQFPSTTAAHVTCIHTGLNVAQSGIYEWNYYEPLVDAIISPLLFSYAGDKTPAGENARDTLRYSMVPNEDFFPRHTFYQALKRRGVQSSIFQHQAYTPSTISNIMFEGATVFPYRTLSEALAQLTTLLLSSKAAASYYFLYFDKIDAFGHHYGPDSKQVAEIVDMFMSMMESLFYKALHGKIENTLFLMIADHGQVEVDPRTTFYLNKHAPGIERYLQSNRKGKFLVPAGSARDMFLHVHGDMLDEAVAFLQRHLEGRAEVLKTQTLIAQNLFGSLKPSTEFLSRVGNVVILPYLKETVWWYEKGKFEMKHLGHHGGLTPEEMEIPLLLLPL